MSNAIYQTETENAYKPTLSSIITQLKQLYSMIEICAEGEPIYWTNITTGKTRLGSPQEHFNFIAEQIISIQTDLEEISQSLTALIGVEEMRQKMTALLQIDIPAAGGRDEET